MEERSLKNKVVLITGGATGIGLHIADNYLKHGAKLTILLDINEKHGADAVKTLTTKHGGNKAVFIKCDVTTDLDTVSKKILETYKTVDILVNNAGILDDQAWKKCIDINVTYLIGWAMKFWDHMRKDNGGKGGTIVNLASIYGYRVEPYLPVYQASKFAVLGFTRSLGHKDNYKKTGVRVVAICPGFTETNLTVSPKTWDDVFFSVDFTKYLNAQAWQKVEAVGKAAADVFETAESGSAWLIEGGRPIVEVVN
ncbi:hypothetical protein JYU34_012543 [Plutella xylostella]|uniref:Uncharacterized protein n=1 Tax=Plutella xylostella TaxID=51655 RepID=A0ABQ7QBK3_PLUXY|nr:hypothetical protein JYU34_012543 [Plutella xylostella]